MNPANPSANRVPGRQWIAVALIAAMASVGFLGVWHTTFWGPFTPRVLEIGREQYASGSLLRVPTFSGMPFLEKPPLLFNLLAIGFRIAGGPSVFAARIINGLMMIFWLAAAMMTARRASGGSAALLTGCLLSGAGVFCALADRVSVDAALAATLTVALLFLWRATSTPGEPVRRGPWLLGLAAGGLAFLTKGFFGMFLFLAPLVAYALWARDRRIVWALLRPSSLLVLAAPVLCWAAVLYADGGATYLFEAFVNNTVGRFLHVRFDVAGIDKLPYGDVSSPQVWWFYAERLGSLAGPALLLLPFATVDLLRRWTCCEGMCVRAGSVRVYRP